MREYFIHKDNEHHGPFNLEELKTKRITKDTLIWYNELEEWTTADKIDELKELIYVPAKNEFSIGKILLSILSVLLIVIKISSLLINYNKTEVKVPASYYNQEITTFNTENEHAKPEDYLKINYKFSKKMSDKGFNVQDTIINTAYSTEYKDAIARVTYYNKKKKELGIKEYTIHDTFKRLFPTEFSLKIKSYTNTDTIKLEIINAKLLDKY